MVFGKKGHFGVIAREVLRPKQSKAESIRKVMYNKLYYVYIMANHRNTALYTGVTNSLSRRNFEHKAKHSKDSFTGKYHIYKLVYFEEFTDIQEALIREKQIKGGSRQKKIDLVNKLNSEWRDLFDSTV